MCEIHDAERHEQLAALQQEKGLLHDAYKSYLEASSIYVLQAEMSKHKRFTKNNPELTKNKRQLKDGTESLLTRANHCYRKAKEMHGEKFTQELNAQELAQRTLTEGTHQHGDMLTLLKQEMKIPIIASNENESGIEIEMERRIKNRKGKGI